MNKKFLIFGLVGILVLGVITAIGYYALFSASFTVSSAIVMSGENEQELSPTYAGENIIGEQITISNLAPTERIITLSDDGGEDVSVSYISELELTQKDVDFNADVWNIIDGEKATVRYTLIGDEFEAEVMNGLKEGYELVYYKDNSDRFNSPAKAVRLNDIAGNLPYEDDANKDEYDYCLTEEYSTCHGAKIWYVPSSAILEDGSLDWSQADNFLFETKLVQYNQESELTIYGEDSLEITPIYHISNYAEGDYEVTTTIE